MTMNDQCAQKNIVSLACVSKLTTVSNSLGKHRLILLSLCIELFPVPEEIARSGEKMHRFKRILKLLENGY